MEMSFIVKSMVNELTEQIAHIETELNKCQTKQDYQDLLDAVMNDLRLIKRDLREVGSNVPNL